MSGDKKSKKKSKNIFAGLKKISFSKKNKKNVSHETLKEKPKEKNVGKTILGGKYGDYDIRTKRTVRWGRYYKAMQVIAIGAIIWLLIGWQRYHEYVVSNSTPFGQTLTCTKSGATVTLEQVATDKNREVTIIELGYSNTSRQKLSIKGTNYGINIAVNKKSDLPDGMQVNYGILENEGNAYLIIKGKLKQEAYQFYLLNRFTFDDGSDTLYQSKQFLDKEKTSVEGMISNQPFKEADKNGLFNFSNTQGPVQDFINFRINPYSKNTTVYDGSFLDENGEIDYNKIIHEIGVKRLIKETDTQIKLTKEKMEEIEKGVEEFTDRLLANPTSQEATRDLETAQKAYQDEKENLERYEEQKKFLNDSKFTKENFGSMNTDYNVIVQK